MKSLIKKMFLIFGFRIERRNKNPEFNNLLELPIHKNPFFWLQEYSINTIVDIGSNEGQFAERILEVFPNADLHCFEPLFEEYGKLKQKFSNRNNVRLYNFGLGNTDEEIPMHRNEYSPSSSLLDMLDLHKENFHYAINIMDEKVRIRRIDEVFTNGLKGPLLVKIDVQGYEMRVLDGGEKLINNADFVIIEASFYPLYKDQPLFEDIYEHLIRRGFRYAGSVEQLIAPKDQKILQADAVFVRYKKTIN